MTKHEYFRVYKNGQHSRHLMLDEATVAQHIEYNNVWRFGCAQFVDGKCVSLGYLTTEEVLAIENQHALQEIR